MGTTAGDVSGIDSSWRLLAEAGGGDEAAFASLVERHQDRLLRLCERVLGDRDEARDATQEVFLKAYRHAGRAEPRGELYTWLYRIALNLCFNRMRRRKIVRFLSFDSGAPGTGGDDGSNAAGFEPSDARPGAEHELLAKERWDRTRRAIDALPENQRAVLLLARFEGLSQKEIAETLAISEGAVESRLVRAMRRLQASVGSAQEPASNRVSPEGGERR